MKLLALLAGLCSPDHELLQTGSSVCSALTLSSLPGEQTHTEPALPCSKGTRRSTRTEMRAPQVNRSLQLAPLCKHHNLSLQTPCQARSSRTTNSAGIPTSQGDGWGQEPALGFDERNFSAVIYCAQVWLGTRALTFKTCKENVT